LIPLLTIQLVAGSTSAAAQHVKDGAIQIDGAGNDEGWRSIAWSDGFVQHDPNEGDPPSERTRVKSAYDTFAVYFLVEAFDSQPDQIVGRLTRRDALSASDWIHVWLDTFDDDRTAYRFSVNPAGVKQDARVSDEVEDINWNGIWEVGTHTSTTGWIAELRIPLSQLRYHAGRGSWGFQVGRDLVRLGEKSYLSSTPRGSTTIVRHFATLDGLDELPSSWPASIEPYALGGVEVDASDPSLTGTLGGEARLGLCASMNLSLTINPDFGQVEADPSALNLSSAELFFEDKRAFFLEGKELFDYRLGWGDGDRSTLFYTRRIGRAPSGGSSLGDDEEIIESPLSTPILGAVKLTGKTSDGWSIGLLEAITGDANGTIDGPAGDRERTLEPLSNAAVARVAKDFREGQTTVGLMATHLFRRPDEDTRHELIDQAVSGGVDINHRVGDYQVIARAHASHLAGTPAAIEEVQRSPVHYFQRPDADHLKLDPERESLSGWGATLVAGKTSGKHWRAAAGAQISSPEFNPNPLGYLPRADAQFGFLWAQYREDDPGPLHRSYLFNFNLWGQKTFGNEINAIGGNINATWILPDTSMLWAGTGRDLEGYSVNLLFGGPALRRPGGWAGWAGGQTDDRKPVTFLGDFFAYYDDDGAGYALFGFLTLKVRPAPSVEIALEPWIERRIYNHQFVEEIDGASIVGHLAQTTTSLALRANWTLTPELSLQIYASPYLSSGTYTDFREVTDARAREYSDRFQPYDYGGDDRFRFAQLRSNVVVRWEYLLGSTLFVVWSHEQTLDDAEHGTLDLDRDLAALVRSDSIDTVLVKVSYWLAL
jgi:hypothetical protein